jgi:uncharacterized membrane protein YphA (DoxX/SURF4 family)
LPATSEIPVAISHSPASPRTWKTSVAAIAAILLGIIYLVSGAFKTFQPYQAGELLEQAKVPGGLGILGACVLGALELFAAFLLFTPRFRRWGGLFGSGLMIFFIGWVAWHYQALAGIDCGCFPLIKRTIGPGFFISDAVFLLFGLAAWRWSPGVPSITGAASALVALAVLSGASLGVNTAIRHNVQVPNPVIVDGKAANITHGKVFLFFYDPQCSHCQAAARFMSTLNWGDTRIIGIPTQSPQFAKYFQEDTHLNMSTSTDVAKLKKAFPFVDPPFGVALNDGESKGTFQQAQFNEPSPAPDLRKLGFVK